MTGWDIIGCLNRIFVRPAGNKKFCLLQGSLKHQIWNMECLWLRYMNGYSECLI